MALSHFLVIQSLFGLVYICHGLPIDSRENSDYDECDSTIWDYGRSDGSTGVRNILAHCSAGQIIWKNEGQGAVQVSLLPSFKLKTKYFEACFIAKTAENDLQISLDGREGTLQKLVVLSQSNREMEREKCIKSEISQPVILYLETVRKDNGELSHLGQMEIDYDIQPVTSLSSSEDLEECKPCTEEEVLETVCTSDFVLKGSMNSVQHHVEEGETSIHLDVSHIHHQTDKLFYVPQSSRDGPVFSQQQSSHPRGKSARSQPSIPASPAGGGTVTVPHKCGILHGEGEFLFIGRVRLGRAFLRCAPRVEEFERLWRRAVRAGRNHCVL